jgi:hypothetical protein
MVCSWPKDPSRYWGRPYHCRQGFSGACRIVFLVVNDPVEQGFILSMAHPGGNVTGFLFIDFPIFGRSLQRPATTSSKTGPKLSYGSNGQPAKAMQRRNFRSDIFMGTNIGRGAELTIDTAFTATEGTAAGANQGSVQVNSGGQFTFGGTFNNSGNVDVVSGGTATVKRFDMTLKGGGAFGLDSDSVLGVPAFITLTNVDNLIGANGTIQGAGTLINQSKGRVEGLILNGTGTIMSTTPARSRLTRVPIRRES